jgi:hypothetical protein
VTAERRIRIRAAVVHDRRGRDGRDPAVSLAPGASHVNPDDRRHYLEVYLADHHAGAVAALELARRCRAENEDNAVGAFLRDTFIPEVEQDRAVLERIMAQLGVARRPVKDALAWFGEKVARLKLNGALSHYSPLSRVVELEALTLGVRGKRSGWRSLAVAAAALDDVDLDALIARADAQESALEVLRTEAARGAFA